MKYTIVTCLIFLASAYSAVAQVEINSETTKKEKQKQKVESTKDDATTVFLVGNWSSTTRKLVENDGLFGDSLGARANETGIGAWSVTLGIQNKLNEYLTWEGGISYITNGEALTYEDQDTSYKYTTKYSYIGMPVKLYYTYGNELKLFVGAGIIPQMFMRYDQDRSWVNSNNEAFSEDFVTKSGYNSFVLSAVFNVGIKWSMSERVGLLVMPEYRLQLTSSYEKTDSYKHYARALGVNFGLTIDL